MPTHPIGPGTRNLSVNVRQAVHRALGRVAMANDISCGELVRRMLRLAARVWHAATRADRAASLDLQAVAKLRYAQTPASDGGCTITVHELAEVEQLIEASAHLDGRIAHGLNLKASA